MGTYCERGNCSRQFEAPRSSTAGIDKENPAPFFDYRLVRMAGDDSRESRGIRVEVESPTGYEERRFFGCQSRRRRMREDCAPKRLHETGVECR